MTSWTEYEATFNVDVLHDAHKMRCRACGCEWAITHNRGKMLQRMHRCPDGCNGRPRRSRDTSNYAPAPVVDRLRTDWDRQYGSRGWEYDGPQFSADDVWTDPEDRRAERRERRLRTKVWFTARLVTEDRRVALDRFFDEADSQADPFKYVQDREAL